MTCWDETHEKLYCGDKGHVGAGSNKQVRFRRDADDKVDNEHGVFASEVMVLQTKYNKEVGVEHYLLCVRCFMRSIKFGEEGETRQRNLGG